MCRTKGVCRIVYSPCYFLFSVEFTFNLQQNVFVDLQCPQLAQQAKYTDTEMKSFVIFCRNCFSYRRGEARRGYFKL